MIKGQKKGDNKMFRKSYDDFWLNETLELDLNVFFFFCHTSNFRKKPSDREVVLAGWRTGYGDGGVL